MTTNHLIIAALKSAVTFQQYAESFISIFCYYFDDDLQMFPCRCYHAPPYRLSPVILGLQEVELLLDPVTGLGDSEL